jgi:CubicO group peptidase (beta-lactamase class C family)
MTSSHFDPARVNEARLAAGHTRLPEEQAARPDLPTHRLAPDSARDHTRAAAPAGGLYSSLGDLARFASFALTRAPGPLSLAWQRFPYSRQLGSARAAGLVGHSGVISGYSAELWLLPRSGLAVIALSGSGFGSPDPQRLTELVATLLGRLSGLTKGEGR